MSKTDLEIVATFLAVTTVFFAGLYAIERNHSKALNGFIETWKGFCDRWEERYKEACEQRNYWRDAYLAASIGSKEDDK